MASGPDERGDSGAVSRSLQTSGNVLNWGGLYDLVVWFSTLGRESELRESIANLAQLQPGESVLDVGCGTGTLALVAKQRVGETGQVCGIDPGSRQIARARGKAARSGSVIDFQVGGVERLPYADRSFDAVVTTFVMHHLTGALKDRALNEIRRVLKPGGRLLVVDFKRHEAHPTVWLHRGHAHAQGQRGQAEAGHGVNEVGVEDQPDLMQHAGFTDIEVGDLPFQFRHWGRGSGRPGFALARSEEIENVAP